MCGRLGGGGEDEGGGWEEGGGKDKGRGGRTRMLKVGCYQLKIRQTLKDSHFMSHVEVLVTRIKIKSTDQDCTDAI